MRIPKNYREAGLKYLSGNLNTYASNKAQKKKLRSEWNKALTLLFFFHIEIDTFS